MSKQPSVKLLRDEFALRVLPALFADVHASNELGVTGQMIATRAYKLADLMMGARNG